MAEPSVSYDPVRYLDLLLADHISRETSRARRNLAVLAFAIIMVHFLKVPLDKLKFGDVPILEGNEPFVTAVAAVLFVYWGILFAVRYRADWGRRQEQKTVIDDAAQSLKRDKETIKAHSPKGGVGLSYRRVEAEQIDLFLKHYEAQDERTAKTRFLLSFGRFAFNQLNIRFGAHQ